MNFLGHGQFSAARSAYLEVLDECERETDIVDDLRERLQIETQRCLDLERERDTLKVLVEILTEYIDNGA